MGGPVSHTALIICHQSEANFRTDGRKKAATRGGPTGPSEFPTEFLDTQANPTQPAEQRRRDGCLGGADGQRNSERTNTESFVLCQFTVFLE